MAEDILTSQEQYKLRIINQVLCGEIKQTVAAKILGISSRQVRRLQQNVEHDGQDAVIHKLKGKQSNHALSSAFKETVLSLVIEKYVDFKPTFASEKLQEYDDVCIQPQTLRRWMAQEKIWKTHKRKHLEYHSWRPRKDYYGELEQFDGSYHLWFENRFVDAQGDPIEVCLLAAIDDATGNITKAVFAANEGITAVFTFWKEYCEELGKPLAIYLDKFSTYKINHKAAVDNHELMTQFQRALKELSITLIHAHSPQAKGRIERLFLTLQDRLVKDMRLADISSPEAGNNFLKEAFLPTFNKKFSVVPTKEGNVHRILSISEKKQLDHIFSLHETRRVNNDFTVQFKNIWYQLAEIQPVTVRPKESVLIETWLDDSIHILLR